jgi:copper transport protein
MPRTRSHRFALLAFVAGMAAAVVFGLSASSVFAHNTLVSSDPADGATLRSPPTQITWLFDNSVPLETMTVTLVDVSGARTELTGSTHGPAGDTQVITPLPVFEPGPVSVRWRLVGPDGHPITGRVEFTIASNAPSTTSAAATGETTVPAASAAAAPSTSAPATIEPVAGNTDDGSYATSSLARWVLRYVSYLAILAVVGILFTSAYVWPGAGTHRLLRQVLSWSLLATAVLGFVQVLVVASDISGEAPWSSFGAIDAATTTSAGMAFMIRIVLALAMWIVLFQYRIAHRDVYWTAVSLPGLGLLATWAFAGHARSMRWPVIGVATDVAHHAAAAAWIAGLAIVGWIIIPKTQPDIIVPAVRNFSRVAAICVGVLVTTGVVQSLRLVGSPNELLDVEHGRYLAAKVVILGVMLVIASVNRRRVNEHIGDTSDADRAFGSLRRAIVVEFAIGLMIVGITAAMVVSPPATGLLEAGASANAGEPLYYAM